MKWNLNGNKLFWRNKKSHETVKTLDIHQIGKQIVTLEDVYIENTLAVVDVIHLDNVFHSVCSRLTAKDHSEQTPLASVVAILRWTHSCARS